MSKKPAFAKSKGFAKIEVDTLTPVLPQQYEEPKQEKVVEKQVPSPIVVKDIVE